MIVKSTRPGILLVADAGLKLRKGETAEVTNATPQVEAAFKRGFLVEVQAELAVSGDLVPGSEVDSPKPETTSQRTSSEELGSLNANDAIARVSQETDPTVLERMMGSEKRKTVLDAMKLRLKEVQSNDAE